MHITVVKRIPAIVALVGVSLLLAACGGQAAQPVGETPPPDPPVLVLSTFPVAELVQGVEVDARIYKLPSWFEIPLTIDLPEGWRIIHIADSKVFALVGGTNSLGDASNRLVFLPIYDNDAEQFFSDFQTSSGLEMLEPPMDVRLAGLYPATQLDMLALPNPDFAGEPDESIPAGAQILDVINTYTAGEFRWTTSSVEARIRVFKVQIEDRVLILYIETLQEDFDSFIQAVHPVLFTLKIVEN